MNVEQITRVELQGGKIGHEKQKERSERNEGRIAEWNECKLDVSIQHVEADGCRGKRVRCL